jgi:hypothetical protein
MRKLITFMAVAAVLASASMLVSAEAQRTRPGQNQPQMQTATFTRADAELIAKRLYKAILGREADATGLTVAVAEIQRGRLGGQVQGMLDSNEFQDNHGRKPSAVLLQQFYRGILNREPDTAGVQGYLGQMDRGQFAPILLDMINSAEFRNILASPPTETPRPSAPATPQVNRLDAALACQGKVIAAVRSDAGGRIFLTFDRMPEVSGDGQTVSGPAVDRFNNDDRQMTYRCAGRDVTYSYADRRPAKAADSRLNYPSAAVRNCQNAIREGLAFDAASLSASDTNTEYVLGIVDGRVRQCTMDRQRVVSVK